ncbi:MAG: serine hydrolase domain-containing protein [Rhodospirillaceae bacterium]
MDAAAMQTELDRLLADAVARGDVAHAAGVVANAGGILFQGQAGPRRMGEPERPLQPDTVYWLHSMTKPITAGGVMQLVEQGRIGLDDDCGALVPALANPNVLEGFDADGQPIMRPAWGAITLRRLLTHTAGFVYDNWNPMQRAWMEKTGTQRIDFYTDPAKCPPLGFDPGARWEYGINIDWAGKVLEAVTGETLEHYLRTKVLEPLGMASTGYVLTASMRERLSGVHRRDAAGTIHADVLEVPDPQDPRTFTGGGQMFGTVSDYARFMRMILNEGELDGVRVLAADTVRSMAQNHMGDILVGTMPAAIPEHTCPFDLYPGVPKQWGLSFMINMEDLPGRRRAGSLAWGGLRNTYFWIDPKSGIAAAFFTQMLPFVDPKTVAVFDDFERAVYATAGAS